MTSNFFRTIFYLIPFILLTIKFAEANDRVKLKDIQALTLYSDRYTTSRRGSPTKQVECRGKYCNKVRLDTVQCYNRGSDGLSIQWECQARFPSEYRFGRLNISCEGYDGPEDEYIVAGSCALRYTIELSESTRTHRGKKSEDSFPFVPIIIFICAIFFIYWCCIRKANQPNNQGVPPRGPFTNFFPSPSVQPSAPPPPGFRPDLYGQPAPNAYMSGGHMMGGMGPTYQQGRGGGGGSIWPGAIGGLAAGGLMGYLFGSSGHHSGIGGHHNSEWGGMPSRNDDFDGDFPGGGVDDTHESTGFASTTID